jgi:tetratricopeptide (TPR) repeat protein
MRWILLWLAGSMVAAGQGPATTRFQEGLASIQKGDIAEAETHVRAGLAIDPRAAAGYDLLGIVLDAQGRPEAAQDAFRQAIRLNPRLIPAYNNLGRSLYRGSHSDEAKSQFEQALKLDPANFTANYSLGIIARDVKEFDKAAQYLGAAHRARPTDGPTLMALTGACLDAGRKEDAINAAALVGRQDPAEANTHFSLGVLFLRHQLYEPAAEHLAQARLAEPRNFELLHNLGQAYAHLRKYPEAEQSLLAALQVRPDSPDTLYQLARVYSEQRHSDQAIQVLVRARQMTPDRPDILLLLSRECIREGFWDDAESVLRECIRLDPGKVEPRLLLGESYSRSKAYEKALAEYEVIARLDAKNPQSYVSLGRTFYYLERYPDSQAALTEARKLDPVNAQAAYYLGLIAEKKDNEKEAAAWFEEALKRDPKHLGSLYEYGTLLARQSELPLARTYLERASQVSPGFSQPYYRLTIVYKRLNEPELATKAFARFQECKREEERANYRPYGVLAFVKETQDLPATERLGRYREELARAEQMRPNDINVMFMLAQIDLRLGDTGKSLATIQKLVEAALDDAQIRLRTASLLTTFHMYPMALRQLREFLDRHPTADDVRFALAALYAELFRSAEAIEVLRSATSRNALPVAHRNLLGRVLMREGEFPEGLQELRAANAAEPRNQDFALDLALGLAQAGKHKAALDQLATTKSKFQGSARTHMVEGLCLQIAGDSVRAADAFRRAADLADQWEAPWLAFDAHQAAQLFPASPWPLWFSGADLDRVKALAPNQPEVYAPLVAAALERGDCGTAQRLWTSMSAFDLAPELNPVRWCSVHATRPAKFVAERYGPLAMLMELARTSSPIQVAETDFAKGNP